MDHDTENPGRPGQGPSTEPPVGPDDVSPGALNDEDRILLVMAYLGPLCLVPLFGRKDPFVRWHARQGLALMVVAAAVIVALYPIGWLFARFPGFGPLFAQLFLACELLVGIGFLAVISLAIERALGGRKFRVPWLSDLADQD